MAGDRAANEGQEGREIEGVMAIVISSRARVEFKFII